MECVAVQRRDEGGGTTASSFRLKLKILYTGKHTGSKKKRDGSRKRRHLVKRKKKPFNNSQSPREDKGPRAGSSQNQVDFQYPTFRRGGGGQKVH